jgi:hypothetical protein
VLAMEGLPYIKINDFKVAAVQLERQLKVIQ